jgi:hypothetical protein
MFVDQFAEVNGSRRALVEKLAREFAPQVEVRTVWHCGERQLGIPLCVARQPAASLVAIFGGPLQRLLCHFWLNSMLS